MSDFDKILDAWIMMEHLSEGDINPREKKYKRFDDFDKDADNFYDYFTSKSQNLKSEDYKYGGLILYIDIFEMEELLDFFYKKFELEPTDEETDSGTKFTCSLCFDLNLQYIKDKLFFTEPGYILHKHVIPERRDFDKFEKDLKDDFLQRFEWDGEYKAVFNRTLESIISAYASEPDSLKKCMYQFVPNFSQSTVLMHSSFLKDLAKAKEVESANLTRYLAGNIDNSRKNLNCRDENDRLIFNDILDPENYPLGRFPSKTEYALSFMQQVAVNLAVSYKDQKLRSVNGPPGTGKTTLLKDVFADLIVKQAKAILDNCGRKFSTTGPCEIEILPQSITENSILVLSSNNGAVQNIVNELPLNNGISENLIEDLLEVDYFKDIANSSKTKNNNPANELDSNDDIGSQEYWGLFSLEGGKSDNEKNILNKVTEVEDFLNSDSFTKDPNSYAEFEEQYRKVKALQKQALDKKIKLDVLEKRSTDLQERTKEVPIREEQKENLKRQLEIEIPQLQNTYKSLESNIENISEEVTEIEDYIKDFKVLITEAKNQKVPFWQFAKKKEKEIRLKEITDDYKKKLNNKERYLKERKKLERQKEEKEVDVNNKLHELQEADEKFELWKCRLNDEIEKIKDELTELNPKNRLDLGQEYDKLQISNPWFDEQYRIEQSKLFILALRLRKQFLYEKKSNIKNALDIWKDQKKYSYNDKAILAAWNWINFVVPVISSTFASFSRMMRNIKENSLGYVFVDEAGQAVPQAAVGAIFRSTNLMVVGDPAQIKPVLTLDSKVLGLLSKHYSVDDRYISGNASVQTLVDRVGEYGFYKSEDPDSWIGIPLWVHRRCKHPMFDISNRISYNDCMVQGTIPKKGESIKGRSQWFDIKGKAIDKYVSEQGDFLVKEILRIAEENPDILDHLIKDQVYVISPFKNVATKLAERLSEDDINFTHYDDKRKPTNVGTVHTFQGREAPIVFLVLGADNESKGAARWAVTEANIMNVAATRAKKEFYIIGDKSLYESIGTNVINKTLCILNTYNS